MITQRDRATAYAGAVMRGEILANRYVRLACQRHLTDLETGHLRGLSWDLPAAERHIQFFPDVLRLAEGEHAGHPFHLSPWQQFIIGSLFGWKRTTTGYRRFRTAYVEVSKGAGKTPMAAGLALALLTIDKEASGEVYTAATMKDQARLCYRDAERMVVASPELSARIVITSNNLLHFKSGSFLRPVSSEHRGLDGKRVHGAVIDELHEHPSALVVDKMRAGTKGRRQPMIFEITNSGTDRQSVCYQHHEYSVKVLKGQLENDQWFAFVCGLDPCDACAASGHEQPVDSCEDCDKWYDEAVWKKANPNIGVSIPESYLREQVKEAYGMPSKESIVRRLNFCEWMDAVDPWIDGDLWRQCEREDLVVPAGGALGLDLSAKRDLLAAARAVEMPDGSIEAEVRFWTPSDTLEERERQDRVPYSAWVKAGYLIAVPGRSIDYDFVVRDLADWLTASDGLAFDQWRIEDFQRALDDAGIDCWIWDPPRTDDGPGIKLVRHGQGWQGGKVDLDEKGQPLPKRTLWMPQSITELEDLIVKGRCRIRRNPVLTWNSASAVLERDAANNAKWEKRKSTGRIDGIVALCMAVGLVKMPAPAAPNYDVVFLGGV